MASINVRIPKSKDLSPFSSVVCCVVVPGVATVAVLPASVFKKSIIKSLSF